MSLPHTSRAESAYIKTGHPKTEISSDRVSFENILKQGWWGQAKIHGHRAQIHLSADSQEPSLVYNRHGKLHARRLDVEIEDELRRIIPLKLAWSAIEAEWLKNEKKIYIFDFIKMNGRILSTLSYQERYEMIPRIYQSEFVSTLSVLRRGTECLQVFSDPDPKIEGLIFKSSQSIGFSDSALIRCRKKPGG